MQSGGAESRDFSERSSVKNVAFAKKKSGRTLPRKSMSANDVKREKKFFQKTGTVLRRGYIFSLPPQKKKCVLHPNLKWKIRWDLVNLLLILFIGVNTPYHIAFVEEDTLSWLTV